MKNTFFQVAFLCSLFAAVGAAQVVDTSGDVRLVTESSGARDVDNGGNTASGRLIGLNAGGIDNFMVYEFNDLSAVAGQTVGGAVVTVAVATGFTNGNHGTADDLINLSALALTNLGWEKGSGAIGGSSNGTDDGSISYQNRVQYLPSSANGTTQPWKDSGGGDTSNVEGALTNLGSVAGYAQGSGPATLDFSISAAIAQSWVDNGLAGLVVSTTDDGNSRSRFAFQADAASISFSPVPEPASNSLMFVSLLSLLFVVRKRAQ